MSTTLIGKPVRVVHRMANLIKTGLLVATDYRGFIVELRPGVQMGFRFDRWDVAPEPEPIRNSSTGSETNG